MAGVVRQPAARHVRAAGRDPREPATAPRDRGRARRRIAVRIGRGLSGGVPESAGRSVPARSGRRRRARRHDRGRLRSRDRVRPDRPPGGVHRRGGGGRHGVRPRALQPGRPIVDEPDPRWHRGGVVPHRGADVHPAAERRDPPPGLLVDPRAPRHDRVGRCADRASVRRGGRLDPAGSFAASSM